VRTETRVGIFVISAVLVFLYLSFNIGALRIDQKNYDTYISFFDETGGLDVKAAVKTSGVRIGYVESIYLREGGKAEVHLKILKSYKLALNAYAMINQETLLGGKIVELDVGDFSTGTLAPGTTLAMPGKTMTSVGDLIDQCRDIAQNVSDIAYSFKTVFSSREGRQQLESTLRNAAEAAENIASVSEVVDRVLTRKEQALGSAIENIDGAMKEMRLAVPKVARSIDEVASDISRKVVPEIVKAGPALESVQKAAGKASEALEETKQVMAKVNSGKGIVGKLINEDDETYDDLRRTVHGLKEYVHRMESLQIYIDMHSETLFKYSRSKGYVDIKVRPSHDYFYQFQVCSDSFGVIDRTVEDVVRRDATGNVLSAASLELNQQLKYADTIERTMRRKDAYSFGFQFCKRFDRLVMRIGLIEGVVGGGLDYYVPLNTDAIHWVTSFDIFDLQGIKRINDNRMHVKWTNKIWFLKNLYTCFGIDDIVSRASASPFAGFGLRFSDSDLKYFMSLFAGVSGAAK